MCPPVVVLANAHGGTIVVPAIGVARDHHGQLAAVAA